MRLLERITPESHSISPKRGPDEIALYWEMKKIAADASVRELARRVEERSITPFDAIGMAIDHGYHAIGDAVGREGWEPGKAMTSFRPENDYFAEWHPKVINEQTKDAESVIMATRVAKLAVLGCVSGPNSFQQRTKVGGIGRDRAYELGTVGWTYDRKSGLYRPLIHKEIAEALALKPDTPVGKISAVCDTEDTFEEMNPALEPGCYASRGSLETIATFQVFGRDVLALLNNVAHITDYADT